MPYCPNCEASVATDVESCARCGAIFGGAGWRPAEVKPAAPKKRSAAGIIAVLGVASVVLPALAFLVGLAISNLVPGCRCDEGAGCHGCGANGLVEFMLFGGFVGALGAFLIVLPASLVIAAIVGVVSSRGSS
jgi:hypothetical protein